MPVGKTTGVCNMEYSHQETCCGSWRHSCIRWTVRRLMPRSSAAGRWSTFVSCRRSIEVCPLPCSEGQRCINRIPLLKNSIYLKIRCSKTMCTFLSSTAVSSDLYQSTTTFSLQLSYSFLSCPPLYLRGSHWPKTSITQPLLSGGHLLRQAHFIPLPPLYSLLLFFFCFWYLFPAFSTIICQDPCFVTLICNEIKVHHCAT